jgi:hypothetical protein
MRFFLHPVEQYTSNSKANQFCRSQSCGAFNRTKKFVPSFDLRFSLAFLEETTDVADDEPEKRGQLHQLFQSHVL